MKKGGKRIAFPEREKKLIRSLFYDDQVSFAEIGRRLGRDPNSIRSVIYPRSAMVSAGRLLPELSRMEIPSRVLSDREERYCSVPRDLTAALMGDPLPGYSALERRA